MTYYKAYGITLFKKHVDANHSILLFFVEMGVDNVVNKIIERQFAKKMPNVLISAIFNFLF